MIMLFIYSYKTSASEVYTDILRFKWLIVNTEKFKKLA